MVDKITDKPFDIERMYNGKQKEEFLNEQYENERTKTTVAYLFYYSKDIEEDLGYDLCDFNLDEIGNVLSAINSMNSTVVRTNGRFVRQYIEWCIRNGRRSNNIHPLANIELKWYDQFAYEKSLYISNEDLKEMTDGLVNAQDAVILELLFNGAFGQGLSELLNLTTSSIDKGERNILKLYDDKEGERELEVSEECMRLVRQALNENEYQNKNGTSEKRRAVSKLIENEYVIKTTKSNIIYEGKADKHLIYRRISMISDFFELPYLTAKNIQKSGMIYYAYKAIHDGRYDNITNELLAEIAERFAIKKNKVNGYLVYNFSMMRQFINKDNILDLYGLEIKD